MKLSQRVTMAGVPLTLVAAALLLPASAAQAGVTTDTVAITVQPTTSVVNTAMTPSVVVQVDKAGGTTVDNSYNGPVTLSYAVNQLGAPNPSGNTVNAVHGVATFSSLTFSAEGFGFELLATISTGATSQASAPFDIVDQLVPCQPGQPCQSGTVSSSGTSAFANVAAAPTSDELAATGGGFPSLSCTTKTFPGVVSFSVQDRSKVITAILAKSLVLSVKPNGASNFNICWGSADPFTTQNGTPANRNPANNNEFEGLLPDCGAFGTAEPCIQHRSKDNAGEEVITIIAPAGDPHITF